MKFQMFHLSKKTMFVGLPLLLVLVALAGGFGYYYFQYQQVLKNPTQITSQEVEQTVKQISRFMDLPAETPTIATVTDISLLKDQAFFSKAQNDDKILIFPTERKVVLYRPSTKKVINFAPLTINNEDGVPAPQTTDEQAKKPISVVIYNGSNVVGLTNSVQEKIATFPELTVVAKENAQSKEYAQTTVVDLNGSLGELAANVARTLGGTVGPFPDGEARPSADLLIIVAQ